MVTVAVAGTAAAAASIPPAPALPETGYPAVAVAERWARHLIAAAKPDSLDQYLAGHPEEVPPVLRTLGSALMTSDATLRNALRDYIRRFDRAHASRVPAAISKDELRLAVSFLLVDPIRFMEEKSFRARVLPLLPGALDASTPLPLRTAILTELNDAIGLDFDSAETIALAWKLAPRSSGARRTSPAALRMPDDLAGPIAASIYSLSSSFFEPEAVRTFVAAVRHYAPQRRIVILADPPIAAAVADLDVDVVPTFGRSYTPWPRDPFTVAASGDRVVLVNRPNLQPHREEDANMVRALVQALPDSLDRKWQTRWTVGATPFHNGHILLTPATAWISIHTVEVRALQILGIDRVPARTFGTAAGVERYLHAVRQAAAELESLYGRPVRFVHPLEASPELMGLLAGGGGYDLDSIVTILPRKGAAPVALVGDPRVGAAVAAGSSDADWKKAAAAYGFTGDEATLGSRVAAAQQEQSTAALNGFLDLVAASLAKSGLAVRRVPLLVIPSPMVRDGSSRANFLITWNNVVLEKDAAGARAEGFASLLPAGDAAAREAFGAAGYRLELFPPLIRSVILSGGYRCASNHVRP